MNMKRLLKFMHGTLLLLAAMVLVSHSARVEAVLWALRALVLLAIGAMLMGDWRAGHLTSSIAEIHRKGMRNDPLQTIALLAGMWAAYITA